MCIFLHGTYEHILYTTILSHIFKYCTIPVNHSIFVATAFLTVGVYSGEVHNVYNKKPWHRCNMELLITVEGYVFQHSSITPKIKILKWENKDDYNTDKPLQVTEM